MKKIPPSFRRLVLGVLLLVTLSSSLLLPTAASQLRSFFTAEPGNSRKADSSTTHLLLISLGGQEETPLPENMVLCSIHRDSGKMDAVSLHKELYIESPGEAGKSLQAAYREGGLEELRQTVNAAFALELAGCIAVDIGKLPQLVDSRGGIAVCLTPEEARAINQQTGSNFTGGLHQLEGKHAMAYWHLQIPGQVETAQAYRQKAMICAFLGQCRDLGLRELQSLLKAFIPILSTDMKQTQLLGLALDVLPMLSQLEVTSHRIPAEGTGTRETRNGTAAWIMDTGTLQQQLTDILKNSNSTSG